VLVRSTRACPQHASGSPSVEKRRWHYFYAFDLLAVDGEDLREWPLAERRRRLRKLIPSVPTRLLYMSTTSRHVGGTSSRLRCAHDLECIVGKLASCRYHADGTSTSWFKIKNPGYTQMTARHELFERRTVSRRRRTMLRVP
jgi:ATP-dependent DNA ligase